MSVEELKALQSKIKRKSRICNISTCLLGLTIFIIEIIILGPFNNFIEILSTPIVIASAIPCIFYNIIFRLIFIDKDIAFFEVKLKRTFLFKVLKEHFDNVVYSYSGFKRDYIKDFDIIDTGDRFTSNDYVSGKYKNINFQQADVKIERRVNDSDGDSWQELFYGKIMIFDFNKDFKDNLIVYNHKFNAYKNNCIFSKIETDDIPFNYYFSVRCENEHEAFYILTPHFMQKLKSINKKLDYGLLFAFSSSKLIVAINNRVDSFEHKVSVKIDEKKIEKDIFKDLKLIMDLVDDLNLDNDLFRKEV